MHTTARAATKQDEGSKSNDRQQGEQNNDDQYSQMRRGLCGAIAGRE
jgi:hypothetical protein